MPAPKSYLTLELPHPIFRTASSSAPYSDLYNVYDYAIGGVPFLAEISPEDPLVRSTAAYKKDQFDNADEPGEQTLIGWWLRSQSSWHLGTGIVNSDVRLDETAQFRFADSEGIDPWTPGQISLLKTTELLGAGGMTVHCLGVTTGGTDYALFSSDTTLKRVDAAGAATSITWGGAGTILSITSDGQNWYAASTDGIYQGALSGTTGSKLWTTSCTTSVVRWAKGRLMASVDNKIYELIPSGAGPLALPGTPVYTHPATSFVWTDIADGPEAIYAIGYFGTESFVLKMAVDAQGAAPALTSATVAAELPRGEVGHAIYNYIGSYLFIGTSKGARVALIGSSGALQYGPLIETPSAVRDFVGQGDFVWAGYSGGFASSHSGLIRISLKDQLPSGRFPHAKDLNCHVTGTVMGVSTMGASGRLVIAVASSGLYGQHATNYEEDGYFLTGRVRFNYIGPKLFKQFNIRATLNGPVAIASIDSAGTEVTLASVSADTQTEEDLPINYPSGPQEYVSFRFTLNRNPDSASSSPVFRGYQIKALPGGPRPRQFVIPLRCYDFEQAGNGTKVGYDGFGIERLELMEALDSAGDVVLFQDLKRGTSASVVIDQIEFRQKVPPQPNAQAWGGVLTVALRGVA
jgi:hypothetical protein